MFRCGNAHVLLGKGIGYLLVACIGWLGFAAHAQKRNAATPWWQKETALSADGRLDLRGKPWWMRAQALREGERFTLSLSGSGGGDVIVARVDGDIIEAVDDTDRAADIWNKVSTTYVVSFGGSGLVDRMVSYIDDNHSGRASEVELRYFRDGYLRYAWFGRSYDGGDASRIFALKRWGYAGNDKGSEFRGNTQIYINKYDAAANRWSPLSECPFSFWDLNQDGRTEVTLRVSATPSKAAMHKDTDYANNYDYMWAKEAVPVSEIEATNLRLSFNIDARPRHDAVDLPHSNFGFTMVGEEPYRYTGMGDFNPRRRAPQTTVHMPWAAKWTPALAYRAAQMSFAWDEARTNFRWEGQFWIYEREYMANTGGPTERWNMRREYDERAGSHPAMYYSAADRRYHLRGAEEGWMEAGHLFDDRKDLEFRWWDDDGDGYLDELEIDRGEGATPALRVRFDPKARAAELNADALAAEYNDKVLPDAIAEDRATIAVFAKMVPDERAELYEREAAKATEPERVRYCLDVALVLEYLKVRDRVLEKEASNPYATGKLDTKRIRDPKPEAQANGKYSLGDSTEYWQMARTLHRMDGLYANGQLKELRAMLPQLHLEEGSQDGVQ
jgi:hypothetical protein